MYIQGKKAAPIKSSALTAAIHFLHCMPQRYETRSRIFDSLPRLHDCTQ
jgi:hypothetical protein